MTTGRIQGWRLARADDDETIALLALALDAEDPGPVPVEPAQVYRTLEALRAAPIRGKAVVLELDGAIEGYAFLIAFWSNELGGELCTVDEVYVRPAVRGQGYGTHLIEMLASPSGTTLWPHPPVALELEVRPDNTEARALYERLGFRVKANTTLRRMPGA